MSILKIQAIAYKVIYAKLFGEDEYYVEQVRSIHGNPEEYSQRFHRFLLILRMGGIANLIVFLLALYLFVV
jgi:uncharacterized membrane protein YecN with MAPEG domain